MTIERGYAQTEFCKEIATRESMQSARTIPCPYLPFPVPHTCVVFRCMFPLNRSPGVELHTVIE